MIIAPENCRRLRPNMPHYGVLPDKDDSMLTWDWVAQQMTMARNYWICSVNPDGSPHSVPIWGVWVEGSLYFGTDKLSVKARNIERDNRVVIHLESGDETVIFHGMLVEARASAALQREIDKCYTEKYGFDPELVKKVRLVFD